MSYKPKLLRREKKKAMVNLQPTTFNDNKNDGEEEGEP